jgi:hypothetical protein
MPARNRRFIPQRRPNSARTRPANRLPCFPMIAFFDLDRADVSHEPSFPNYCQLLERFVRKDFFAGPTGSARNGTVTAPM